MSLNETTLHDQWMEVYKYKMPPHMQQRTLAEIQDAIEFGRKKYQPVTETIGSDDSIVFEDNHNNLT